MVAEPCELLAWFLRIVGLCLNFLGVVCFAIGQIAQSDRRFPRVLYMLALPLWTLLSLFRLTTRFKAPRLSRGVMDVGLALLGIGFLLQIAALLLLN